MIGSDTRRPARHLGQRLQSILTPAPVICFVGTLITDIVYWLTEAMQWANFSAWLLTAGLVMSGPVVLVAAVNFFRAGRGQSRRPLWMQAAIGGLVLLLSLWNIFVHSRDAYTSVVPSGLVLSALVVLLLLIGGLYRLSLADGQGVGVWPETER